LRFIDSQKIHRTTTTTTVRQSHPIPPMQSDFQNQLVPIDQGLLERALVHLAGMDTEPQKPPTKMSLMADSEFVEKGSYVMAALDHVRHERQQATVFSQPFVSMHCNELMRELFSGRDDKAEEGKGKVEGEGGGGPKLRPFNIDEWFAIARNEGRLRHDPQNPMTNPELVRFTGTLRVDWLGILVKQECETPGFTKILYNCLVMEQNTIQQLQKRHAAMLPNLQAGGGFF